MTRRMSGGASVVVDLHGPATVRVVNDVRTRILDALSQGSDVVVDLTDIERSDLSLVQLLFSASLTAGGTSVRFKVTGAPDILRSAAGGSHDVDQLYSGGA